MQASLFPAPAAVLAPAVPAVSVPAVPAGLLWTGPGSVPGIEVSVGRDPDTGLWWFRPVVTRSDGTTRVYGPWGGYHFDVTNYATRQWGEIPDPESDGSSRGA